MHRFPSSRATFLASAPLLAALGGRLAQAQGLQTVRIGATANDTYAEAYYGVDRGFFAAAGIDAQITTFTNGAAVSAAVASGALDVGVNNPVGLGGAVAHGIPFVYIAGGAYYSDSAPTTVLCVAKNAPIQNAKDFAGKTIAVSALKDLTELAVVAYLEKNGMSTNSVQLVELAFSEMGPALERGTVAGAVISEPSLTNAVNSGQARVFAKAFSFIAPRFLISGWFSTKDWYAKNTALAKKVAAAFYTSGKWANANPKGSADVLVKFSKIPAASIERMTRCIYADTITPALIDPLLQAAYKSKIYDRPVSGSELIA